MRRSSLLAFAFATTLFTFGADANAADIPVRMKALVMGATKQPVRTVALDGVSFQSIGPFSRHPYLLWRADPTLPLGFERTHEGGAAWIMKSADTLGLAGFEVVFAQTAQWLGEEVWVYALRVNGVPILDAKVELHWSGGELEGVVSALPGDIQAIEAPPTFLSPDRDWTYWSRREPPQVWLELGWIERESGDAGEITRIVDDEGVHLTRIAPPVTKAAPTDFTFTEWATGVFPDQIGVDSQNNIWFSQPNSGNSLTKFDPVAQQLTLHPVNPGSGPDGMIVDPLNRVWSGCYYSGQMVQYTIGTGALNLIPAPYAPSNPAIPVFSRSTHVWVTDHQNNRISEWDPNTSTWLASVVMPTPNCWVVQGTEDSSRQTLYFSEYNSSQLAKKPWVGPVTDIVLPTGGCAFPQYYRSRVFYSNWNTDRMGVYNVVSGGIVEYAYPIAGELGGPICKTKNNQIVIGTRNVGYVMVFDTNTGTFASYKIPTVFPGLKDGITSDKNGAIWFTETGVNKLARLVLP
ncbi:MAG: hypothetical protein HZA52_08655 [Planctomycetes bacterium]|nr:hypothetical protein [Planctomycetota bacterium]